MVVDMVAMMVQLLDLIHYPHLKERACHSAKARNMACTWANKEVGAGEEVKGRNPSDSRSSNTRQSFRPSTCRDS